MVIKNERIERIFFKKGSSISYLGKEVKPKSEFILPYRVLESDTEYVLASIMNQRVLDQQLEIEKQKNIVTFVAAEHKRQNENWKNTSVRPTKTGEYEVINNSNHNGGFGTLYFMITKGWQIPKELKEHYQLFKWREL